MSTVGPVLGQGANGATIQLVHKFFQGRDPAFQNPDQVLEKEVPLEFSAEIDEPVRPAQGVIRRRLSEPELILGTDESVLGIVACRVERLGIRDRDDIDPVDDRVAKKFARAHSGFGNQSLSIERFAENGLGIFQQHFAGIGSAQGRGGADTAQVPIRCVQTVLQTSNEAGQIRALGTVKGVQFVDDEVSKRVRSVVLPQDCVGRTDEQVVQHLVVGQQNVGRA